MPSPQLGLDTALSALVSPSSQQTTVVPTQAAPIPTDVSAAAQSEPSDFIYRIYPGSDGSQITIYSNDGKRKPGAAFDQAVERYADTGKAPNGFTALTPGMLDIMRKGFEAANQPLQRILPSVGSSIGSELAKPISGTLQHYGIISPQSAQSMQQTAGDIGQGAAQLAANSIATPEQAGSTIGTIAGSYMTGGMSILPQIIGAGLGSAAGYMAGGLATGAEVGPTLTPALIAGGLAAASQGGAGAIRYVLGRGVGSNAQKQVAGDLMDFIKSRYGSTGNVAVLEQMASNPADLAKITKIGLDGIMTDFNSVYSGMKSDILQATYNLPKTLSTGAQNTIRAQISRMTDAGKAMLEGVGDANTTTKATTAFQEAMVNVGKAIEADYPKVDQAQMKTALTKVDAVLRQYWTNLNQYKPGAALLSALKEAGADNGFNAGKFQVALQRFAEPPGSAMADVGNIARRGAEYGTVDRPSPYGAHINIGKYIGIPSGTPVLSKLGNIGGNAGTSYAGTVRGTYPATTSVATAAGAQAVRDFLDRKR